MQESKLQVHQRCVGSCSPRRNALISVSASAGLLRGTRWPAPRTVTMLKPWYSTNLPGSQQPAFHVFPLISASLATEYWYVQCTRCSDKLLVQTCLSRYQGCHWVLIGRPSASTQYREPITGTQPSASPLHWQRKKNRGILDRVIRGF